MLPNNPETNKAIVDSGIDSSGVGHSNANGSKGAASKGATPEELQIKLAVAESTNKALLDEVKKLRDTQSQTSDINKLAKAITDAVGAKKVETPTTSEVLNTSKDFSSMSVDGKSLMEAQATLAKFKAERKVPVSIPAYLQRQFGPVLAVTVNGCRVAVPCDGKTYFINATHAEHIQERIRKVDKQLSNDRPTIVETEA